MAMKKCAHTLCTCMVSEDAKSKFCSPFCEDSADLTTLQCDCGHPGCAAQTI